MHNYFIKLIFSLCLLPLFAFQAFAETAEEQLQHAKAIYDAGEIKQAFQLIRQVADTGDAHAQSLLGIAMIEGKDIEQDFDEGLRLLKLAAAQDFSGAAYNLAQVYRWGLLGKADYPEAIKWYQQAADLDDTNSIYNLALMYRDGMGTKQDLARAVELFQKGASLGDGNSMHNIGMMHVTGSGVNQDFSEAITWLNKAIDAGVTYA
ncbi:MAG: tetratricopeptide repeat protein, partial [Gammaproteobacteria bacterium]